MCSIRTAIMISMITNSVNKRHNKRKMPETIATSTSKQESNEHIRLIQYKWLKQTRAARNNIEAKRMQTFLRPPALGPQDVKERQYAISDMLWSKVFAVVPGTTAETARIIRERNSEKVKYLLRKAIRTKSPIGLATHARNVLAYQQWHQARWPNINWLPLDDTPGTRALHTAILVDYMEDMMDADVSPGSPRARLASLRVAIELCRPLIAWPVHEPIVNNLATVYFKKGNHKKRKVRLYTASEITMMEQRASSLTSPLTAWQSLQNYRNCMDGFAKMTPHGAKQATGQW